jgi:hypothetical protein
LAFNKKKSFWHFVPKQLFVKKNQQNGVIRLSAFCQNGLFGNMSVHPFFQAGNL